MSYFKQEAKVGKKDKSKDKDEDASVRSFSDPAEGANPLPGTEPSTGPEDIPDLTRGSKK